MSCYGTVIKLLESLNRSHKPLQIWTKCNIFALISVPIGRCMSNYMLRQYLYKKYANIYTCIYISVKNYPVHTCNLLIKNTDIFVLILEPFWIKQSLHKWYCCINSNLKVPSSLYLYVIFICFLVWEGHTND